MRFYAAKVNIQVNRESIYENGSGHFHKDFRKVTTVKFCDVKTPLYRPMSTVICVLRVLQYL